MSRWPRASRQTRDNLTTSGLPRMANPSEDSISANLLICVEYPAGGLTIDSRWDITFMILDRQTAIVNTARSPIRLDLFRVTGPRGDL